MQNIGLDINPFLRDTVIVIYAIEGDIYERWKKCWILKTAEIASSECFVLRETCNILWVAFCDMLCVTLKNRGYGYDHSIPTSGQRTYEGNCWWMYKYRDRSSVSKEEGCRGESYLSLLVSRNNVAAWFVHHPLLCSSSFRKSKFNDQRWNMRYPLFFFLEWNFTT